MYVCMLFHILTNSEKLLQNFITYSVISAKFSVPVNFLRVCHVSSLYVQEEAELTCSTWVIGTLDVQMMKENVF